ncbi:hypothetical protein [Streptomyces sp. NPDC007369]
MNEAVRDVSPEGEEAAEGQELGTIEIRLLDKIETIQNKAIET